ncbi:MAG: hypothetical protein JW850_00785 [Thermoflexales bacterium]|nr:hypothetical protein [Thermoflexales bacterium]
MFVWIPVLILLTGALLLAGGRWLRFRYAPALATLAAGLALAAWIGAAPGTLPRDNAILAWRPLSLFGMPLSLRLDEYAWALGLAALLPILASSLRWLVRPDEALAHAPFVLVIGAILLVVVSAANVLTLALAWGLADLAQGAALLAADRQAGNSRSRLPAGQNCLATLLVWMIVVFLAQDHASPYWHLMSVSPLTQALLGLAAVLRILARPGEDGRQPILPDLLPVLAGLALWVRLAVIQAMPGEAIWVWGGLACAVWGGLVAWGQPAGGRSLFYCGLGYAGLLVVAGSGARLTPASLAQATATWLLAMYVLRVSPAFAPSSEPTSLAFKLLQRLPALAALAALATLLGLPATLGWAGRVTLYTALSQMRVSWWILLVLAETLLAGAGLRCVLAVYKVLPAWPAPAAEPEALVLASESNPPAPEPVHVPTWRRLASLGASCIPMVGLLVVVLPLFVLGVWPAALFANPPASQALNVRVWIGWLVPWVGMIALALGAAYVPAFLKLPSSLAGGSKAVRAALDLAWLDAIIFNSLQRVARLAGGLGTLIEGKAALIWIMLILVLALLYLR